MTDQKSVCTPAAARNQNDNRHGQHRQCPGQLQLEPRLDDGEVGLARLRDDRQLRCAEIGLGGLIRPSFVFAGPRLASKAPQPVELRRVLPGGELGDLRLFCRLRGIELPYQAAHPTGMRAHGIAEAKQFGVHVAPEGLRIDGREVLGSPDGQRLDPHLPVTSPVDGVVLEVLACGICHTGY